MALSFYEKAMEVVLYNSTVCRLCGEENDNGTFLYSTEENNQNISDLVNAYLPIKVSDDGQLPRTICPGCTIQLEATVEFINLIVTGQKAIRDLYKREKEYKKNLSKTPVNETPEAIIVEVDPTGAYQEAHPISLQVAGLDKPKRKRGRPPKIQRPPDELALEAAAKEQEQEVKIKQRDEEPTGKRRRKTPERFREVVQGKELEKIFKEEGMTDGEESDDDLHKDKVKSPKENSVKVPEVIGHTESGELVVIVKGKGRGRPKGSARQTRETCAICNKEFFNSGRYMSHIAQHGPVVYQCAACGGAFPTRLHFNEHQSDTKHEGLTVLPFEQPQQGSEGTEQEVTTVTPHDPLATPPSLSSPRASLPDLNPHTSELTLTEELPDESSDDLKRDSSKSECKYKESSEDSPRKHKLKCPHCDKKYSSKQSKSMHIRAAHKGERPYICNECGASFAYPRALTLHSLAHRRRNTNKGFACDLCGKVLNHPSSVAYHKEAEHANQRYVCNKCGKHFKHKQLLQRHQLVHTQNRPFVCKICSSKFKTKANLINHQMLHTGVKKFSCEECKQRFAHKTSLTLHMRWHRGQKPYVCKICDKAFTQKGNLSEHMRIHTGEKPFQCALCPRRFTTSSQHRLHLRRHEPRANRPIQRSPRGPSTVETTSAIVNEDGTITQLTITTSTSDVTHVTDSAASISDSVASNASTGLGTAGLTPIVHKCGWCSRVCPTRWALSKHMRLHTGEKPFHCPHCPRTFADASNLNKHKKQIHKQTSLLVAPHSEPPKSLTVASSLGLEEQFVVEAAPEDERVIYVTYDVDEETAAYQILDSEPAEEEMESPKDVYSGDSLLLDQNKVHLEEPEHMSVTDELGNPLHFTMQDGTRLAITSLDGQSLQVITQDGQTIPVEINGFAGEESPIQDTSIEDLNTKEEPASPVTHYYTIV